MPRRAHRQRAGLVTFAFILSVLGEVVGCGGGGGSSGPSVPQLPWARVRRDDSNSAIGSGGVDGNDAEKSLLFDFRTPVPERPELPSPILPSGRVPIIGRDRSIYVSTEDGLLALDDDGEVRWFVDRCGESGPPLTHLASPTISTDGREIVVASPEYIFRLREPDGGDDPPTCETSFPTGSSSSALVSVDGIDLRLLSFVIGTVDGRLISISETGQRRWSYPQGDPLPGDVSDAPAFVGGGFAIASADGRLHHVDTSGRPRWSASMGGSYPEGEIIPSPATFGSIFTVDPEGDVVAFSSSGTHLWTFQPDEPIVGSLSVSALAVEGGAFIGQNVVFALDEAGTIYGIGSESGELVRFCETDNRACVPSTCPDESTCSEVKRCENNFQVSCTEDADCPGDGEDCTDQFFCTTSNESPCSEDADCEGEGETCEPTECGDAPCKSFCTDLSDTRNVRCVRDLCQDDDPEDSDGFCRREARIPLTSAPATFVGSIAVSTDSVVLTATDDGRVCARGLDGTVPNGRCVTDPANPDGGGSDDRCTPDSCLDEGDSCCEATDGSCAPGRCRISDRPCTQDTCDDDESCYTEWQSGCISLADETLGPAVGTTALSAPVIDLGGSIVVTTDFGIARIE